MGAATSGKRCALHLSAQVEKLAKGDLLHRLGACVWRTEGGNQAWVSNTAAEPCCVAAWLGNSVLSTLGRPSQPHLWWRPGRCASEATRAPRLRPWLLHGRGEISRIVSAGGLGGERPGRRQVGASPCWLLPPEPKACVHQQAMAAAGAALAVYRRSLEEGVEWARLLHLFSQRSRGRREDKVCVCRSASGEEHGRGCAALAKRR